MTQPPTRAPRPPFPNVDMHHDDAFDFPQPPSQPETIPFIEDEEDWSIHQPPAYSTLPEWDESMFFNAMETDTTHVDLLHANFENSNLSPQDRLYLSD